jgi:PLP dependent protein
MTVATASEIAERYARVCDEVGPGVGVVVAGVAIVGENRAQDLERKHALYGDAFRWHFIGHLQSNKAKVVNGLCELVHSVGSDSAARRVTIPALLEVNLSGEESKSGVAPGEIAGFVQRYPLIRGLMTMPPLADQSEASRPYFRRLRELADEHGLTELSMGTSQDYRVAAEEGATLVRVGSTVFAPDRG